jgi:hypothetical protein
MTVTLSPATALPTATVPVSRVGAAWVVLVVPELPELVPVVVLVVPELPEVLSAALPNTLVPLSGPPPPQPATVATAIRIAARAPVPHRFRTRGLAP